MTDEPDNERRREYRQEAVLCIDYEDGRQFLADWTENFSLEGIFVRTNRSCEVGESMQIDISFPPAVESVSVSGEVVWIREAAPGQPRGIGLHVSADEDQRRLAELAVRASALDRPTVDRYRILLISSDSDVVELCETVIRYLTNLANCDIDLLRAASVEAAEQVQPEGDLHLVITSLDPSCRVDVPTLRIVEEAQSDPPPGGAKVLDLARPLQFGQLLQGIVTQLLARW